MSSLMLVSQWCIRTPLAQARGTSLHGHRPCFYPTSVGGKEVSHSIRRSCWHPGVLKQLDVEGPAFGVGVALGFEYADGLGTPPTEDRVEGQE